MSLADEIRAARSSAEANRDLVQDTQARSVAEQIRQSRLAASAQDADQRRIDNERVSSIRQQIAAVKQSGNADGVRSEKLADEHFRLRGTRGGI